MRMTYMSRAMTESLRNIFSWKTTGEGWGGKTMGHRPKSPPISTKHLNFKQVGI